MPDEGQAHETGVAYFGEASTRLVIIGKYDSFIGGLFQLFNESGIDVPVYKNGQASVADILRLDPRVCATGFWNGLRPKVFAVYRRTPQVHCLSGGEIFGSPPPAFFAVQSTPRERLGGP